MRAHVVLLSVLPVLFAACMGDDPSRSSCRQAQESFAQSPYATQATGVEKEPGHDERANYTLPVPSDWQFPGRYEAFGHGSNASRPESGREFLDLLHEDVAGRNVSILDEAPSVGRALVLLPDHGTAQWLFDRPYVDNLYNFEKLSRMVGCAL